MTHGMMRESPGRQCRSEADTSLDEVFVEVSTESAHSAPSPAGGIMCSGRRDRGRAGRKYLAPPQEGDGGGRRHHQSVVAFDDRRVATAPTTPTVQTSANIVKTFVRKFSQRVGSNKKQGKIRLSKADISLRLLLLCSLVFNEFSQ